MAKGSIVHIGRKIERIRMLRGVKQETLATALGITQAAVSKMEQSQKVSEEKLVQIAEILGVTTDAIKNFNEDAAVNNIQNTFHDNAVQNQFNPIEKIVELYERLLKVEREKVELLESQLKKK
jgi:transcriptional regulator with XRE-family HTH domain